VNGVAQAQGPPPSGSPAGPKLVDAAISRRFDPAFPSLVVAAETNTNGPIILRAIRNPTVVRVHGDIRIQQVAMVRFTLRAVYGTEAGTLSVPIRQPMGDGNDHGPTPDLDVSLAVPTDLVNRVVVVQVVAYGPRGALIDAASVEIDPEV
jgi:hypothetical protein